MQHLKHGEEHKQFQDISVGYSFEEQRGSTTIAFGKCAYLPYLARNFIFLAAKCVMQAKSWNAVAFICTLTLEIIALAFDQCQIFH